jgi:thiol:disulfide interchange protein
MKNLLVVFSIVILFAQSLMAQVLDPIDWKFSMDRISEQEAELVFKAAIENKWHLYSQDLPEGGPIPTSFSFDESPGYERVGEVVEITEAEVKYDASFELDLKMFSYEAEFRQKVKLTGKEAVEITGFVEYMCCDDERCLPPTEEKFSFTIPAGEQAGTGTGIETADQDLGLDAGEDKGETPDQGLGLDAAEDTGEILAGQPESKSGTDKPAGSKSNLWIFFLVSFLAGLAAILTPCVFPMIPMTVTFFMRGSENRARAILKGLIFGISIVIIYTSIGLIVSLTSAGADFASQISSHWIPNSIFFVLFLIFAASFLGMFEIVLPSKWVNSADRQADRGGYLGAFFMAFTLVLVSFSCTGPIVGALLVESAGGLAIRPTIGMFGFSLAFALPFTLLSIFPSWLSGLPKSGGWLNSVKVVLGFIVLAFGFKFFSTIDQTYHLGIMSREVYLAIWIVIFTMLGFYLLGKLRFAHDSELTHIGVPRLVLAIASFTFVLYMIPGLFGAPLTTISALIPPKSAQAFDLTEPGSGYQEQPLSGTSVCGPARYSDLLRLPHGLQGYFDFEEGLACAIEQDKPIFLDFNGHACSNCKEMEARVWSDPRVLKRLSEDFIIIALYTDDRTKLPESEWITSSYDGKVKKMMGKKNMDFEITHFNTNTQPLYVIVDHGMHTLAGPMGHDLNVQNFIDFLDKGKQAY